MDSLSQQIHAVHERLPKGVIIIVMGVMNSKMASDLGHVVNRHSLDDRNNYDEKF